MSTNDFTRLSNQNQETDEYLLIDDKKNEVDESGFLGFETVLNFARNAEKGSGQLFARLFENKVVFDHANKTWFFWNGVYWEPDKTAKIFNTVSGELQSQYTRALSEAYRRFKRDDWRLDMLNKVFHALNYKNAVNNVLDIIEKQPEIAVVGDEWDRNAWILASENGIIDLVDGECRPGEPEDYIRDVAPTSWQGIDYPCPRFDRFLVEIFNGDTEKIEFVQRLFGSALIGQQIDHVLAILCGSDGRNGKTVLLNILRNVLGPYMTPVAEEVLLSGKRNPGQATPFLSMLKGKRIAYVTETDEGDVLDAGVVKQLTGGDHVIARDLYSKPIVFVPSHSVFMITNHAPHANSDDEALWERVFLIEFDQRFVNEPVEDNEHQRDPYLLETLESEKSGILAWLVRGCLQWQVQGLNPPQSVKMATEKYRQSEDTLGQFLDERCLIDDNEQVKASVFFASYKDWSKESGVKYMSSTAFGKRMKKRFTCERTMNGYFYHGVSVRPIELELPKAAVDLINKQAGQS